MGEGPVRVLLIEDDDDDFFLTKSLFEELPQGAYQLERVAEYSAALHELDNSRHDLYLVDYRLGQYSGLDLLEEANKRGCNAPLIMLTGQREREVDLRAMQAGAVDYLVKDELTATSLERVMRYALQKKRHEETIRRVNQELERRVHERTAELEQANAHLQNEIAERKRAEEALRQADRRKDEFLATLAHELRNPLTPLVGAMQLIEMQPDDVEQVKRLRQMMGRQLELLVRLIDDLLDVSRISRGKLNLRRECVRLRDVIDSALDVGRPMIDSAKHRLTVRLPERPLLVDGDKVRLAQVVSNLLTNAAKYTLEGGQIELDVSEDDQQAIIRVRDNGVGIPPEMLPRIFDLFTQVDSSTTRSHGGLGIGLTIAKTLVEMHGGSISASSRGAGCGSEFTVRLPLLGVAAENFEPVETRDGEAAGQPLPNLRILIVDDNEPAGYLLSRLLQKLGQQVHIVHSGRAALQHAALVKPHVIFSDIAMPGMSGYELAQRIRASTNFPQPVLIALTGYGQDSDRQMAREAGFDHHLTKPVGLQTLEQLLAGLPARNF